MAKPTNAAIVDLKGRAWRPFAVEGASGYVTYTESSGEIHVPYGTDPVSLMVQAHELSHVRYTSKLWPDAEQALKHLTKLSSTSSRIVGYAEDMRITALAGRLNVKTLPAMGNKLDQPVIDRWVDSFVNAGVPEARVQKAIRFILNEHTTVLRSIGLDLATLQQRDNAERYITACAQHIAKLLERDEKSEESKSKGKGKSQDQDQDKQQSKGKGKKEPAPADDQDDQDEDGESSDKGDEAGDSGGDESSDSDTDSDTDSDSGAESGDDSDDSDDDADAFQGNEKGKPSGGADEPLDLSELNLPDIREAMLQSVPAPLDTQALIQSFQHTLDTADWVPVEKIDRMPLVRRAAQARNRGRRLSETGVVLGSAYDAVAPNERRPFLAKRKGGIGGLTVLIDCSGSMSIRSEQLEQLLLKHPQGVVVTYSSAIERYKDDKAVVRVIASHGRLAATADFRDYTAGGNGCDGPVLEWLAKQPGEKVWICDGAITGKRDKMVFHDSDARAAWLKAHRIQNFVSMNDYLESLT